MAALCAGVNLCLCIVGFKECATVRSLDAESVSRGTAA